MSRSLIALLLGLALVSGCASNAPDQAGATAEAAATPDPQVLRWLDLQEQVEQMPAADIVAALVELKKPKESSELFYYATLNQHLQTYGAWTVARDSFKTLQADGDLEDSQRQLASILRQYNQNRINAYLRQQETANQLAQVGLQLQQSDEDKRLLQEKIQALTELESDISTRRKE